MNNEIIKHATTLLLRELRQEIEKEGTQEIEFSRVHELMTVAYEPVRFLASREKKVRIRN